MSLPWASGLTVEVAPDGRLILSLADPARSFRYPPLATLVVIALHRHGCDPGLAAADIARGGRADRHALEVAITCWLEELRVLGLLDA